MDISDTELLRGVWVNFSIADHIKINLFSEFKDQGKHPYNNFAINLRLNLTITWLR